MILIYNNFKMDQSDKQNEIILTWWKNQIINKKDTFKLIICMI